VVAQRVVHGLEVVEVDQHDADPLCRVGVRHAGLHALGEVRAIGQAGQYVVGDLVAEPFLDPQRLGDITGITDDAADAGIVEQVRRDDLQVPPGAVGVRQACLVPHGGAGPARYVRRPFRDRGPVLGMEAVRQAPHRPVAESAAHGRAGVADHAVPVGDRHQVGRMPHQQVEPPVSLPAAAQRRSEPAAQAGLGNPPGTVTGPVHGDPLVWAAVPATIGRPARDISVVPLPPPFPRDLGVVVALMSGPSVFVPTTTPRSRRTMAGLPGRLGDGGVPRGAR
jgi:hypothetical protein